MSSESKLECSSGKRNLATLIIIFVISFGLFLRVGQYIANRSLWLDEAMLALNIVNRSIMELTYPLAYEQAAPLGFLIIQKIIIELLGNADYILRLFSFIGGIAAVFLMYKGTDTWLGKKTGTFVALGLFVVSYELIYYSCGLRPYSLSLLQQSRVRYY